MPEISFQAAIWADAETGKFRVQIRPYHSQGANIFVAMMDAEELADFIVLCGAELDDQSRAISSKKALILEGVEVDDASELGRFGFTLQQSTGK